jgi:UDP:flavonoid glycosyltransferase YjiC (YdhE family)
MARVLFVTWDGGGNVPPAFGAAQVLIELGHEVVVAGQELAEPPERVVAQGYKSLRERCEARGFPFSLLERSSAAWAAGPPEPRIVAGMMACPGHIADVSELLLAESPDVVVVDCLMFGALAAVEDVATPVAALVHSAPGLLMAPGGQMEAFLLRPVNDLRTQAGRTPVVNLWDAWSRVPAICTTIPEMDPLAATAPASFEYVGPVFDRLPTSGWQPPWGSDDDRPLVLVSFASTSAWDQQSRIQRTLDALGDGRYRLLVTTSRADVAALTVPKEAVLLQHVPHHDVLPHVSVMVSHAGHGSVLTALAHAVPLVCLPNPVADQPGIASQVEVLGAGLALDGDNAAPGEIRAAVLQILENPSYSIAARRLATLISNRNGAASAADLVARLAGGHPT